MLKRACVYLFILISDRAYAINNSKVQSDTNKISIKVILWSKPLETEDSYKFSDQKNAETNKTKPTPALPRRSFTKKERKTKRGYISYIPESAPKILKPQNSTLKDTLKSRTNFKNAEKIQKQEEKKQYKNAYFLTSLLLLITGTVVCIFFRSGLPFIIAVLFLIGGYYVLVYALLFI